MGQEQNNGADIHKVNQLKMQQLRVNHKIRLIHELVSDADQLNDVAKARSVYIQCAEEMNKLCGEVKEELNFHVLCIEFRNKILVRAEGTQLRSGLQEVLGDAPQLLILQEDEDEVQEINLIPEPKNSEIEN